MVGAVALGDLELEHHMPGAVDLHEFIGQCRARDVAAQLFHPLALVGAAAHRRVQAEALTVVARSLGKRAALWHVAWAS